MTPAPLLPFQVLLLALTGWAPLVPPGAGSWIAASTLVARDEASAASAAALCRVSLLPRAQQPGDVLFVRASCDVTPSALTGRFGTLRVPFFPLEPIAVEAPEAGRPESGFVREVAFGALVGIDLATRPGARELAWHAAFAGERSASGSNVVPVEARAFPVQRLNLPRRYVAPDSASLARIEEERRRLAAALSVSTPERIWRGAFTSPLAGARGSGFGARRVLNGRRSDPHVGIDLAAPEGTPVHAPNHGVVVFVDTLYYAGKTVVLDHGLGLFTVYSHLSQTAVLEGDPIEAGQLLGRVGTTGRVTGPHLHWAARINGARVDPVSLVAVTRGAAFETPDLRIPIPRE